MVIRKKKTNENKLSFYLLISPLVFAFSMVVLIPFIMGLYYSFTDWNAVPGKPIHFIGLTNYISIFKEPQIIRSLLTTFQYAIYAVVLINLRVKSSQL